MAKVTYNKLKEVIKSVDKNWLVEAFCEIFDDIELREFYEDLCDYNDNLLIDNHFKNGILGNAMSRADNLAELIEDYLSAIDKQKLIYELIRGDKDAVKIFADYCNDMEADSHKPFFTFGLCINDYTKKAILENL